MKSKLWIAVVMGLLATSLSATVATAQTSGSCDTTALMIKFDADAFAYETAYTPATFTSAAGSQLTVVGTVSLFCNPLLDLSANDPNIEYTFIWDGLVSQGTVTRTRGSSTTFTTKYLGGGFRIYAGTPHDAPTALTLPALPAPGLVPDAFVDGTLILSGVMTDSLYVYISRTSTGTFTSSLKANYRCTGGTHYDQVGSGTSVIDGFWLPVPATNPEPPVPLGTSLLPAGWSAHPNGKWDRPPFIPPVAVVPSSWGKLKSIYR